MENSTDIKPLISIVICTYNNAESLNITLQQLIIQKLAHPEMVELIVIDNNSQDNTAEILQTLTCNEMHYKHYFESRQGVSYARNTAIEKAAGEYILSTDDDAEIPPYWIERYINKVLTTGADCIFGTISVIWDQPKPWWYDDQRYQGFFATIDYGDKAFQVKTKSTPFFGKNFCIKKNVLLAMGGFNTALGRKGTDLIGGEEILLFFRLIEEQKIIQYDPDLAIAHRLKPREYTEENICKQYLACAKPILLIAKTQPGKRLFGKPLGVLENQLKDTVAALLTILKAGVSNNKKESFYQHLRLRRALIIIKLWLLED